MGLYVSTLQHLALETLIILARTLSSMPNFFPIARDSAMPIIWIASDMLLHSLAICPPLAFPQLKKFFPIPSKQGLHLSKISLFLDPTIKVRVPAAAPVTPPDTGASTYVMPADYALDDSSWATMGAIVLQSIMREPFLAFLKMPELFKLYLERNHKLPLSGRSLATWSQRHQVPWQGSGQKASTGCFWPCTPLICWGRRHSRRQCGPWRRGWQPWACPCCRAPRSRFWQRSKPAVTRSSSTILRYNFPQLNNHTAKQSRSRISSTGSEKISMFSPSRYSPSRSSLRIIDSPILSYSSQCGDGIGGISSQHSSSEL